MREYLFRGKTKDGKWVEGNGIMQGQDCISYARWVDICDDRTRYEVIPETVGQYTGLTDKNGKKIFEGDIIKDVTASTDNIYKILFSDRGYFYADNPAWWEFIDELGNFEVIGNIHDNPELLEGV